MNIIRSLDEKQDGGAQFRAPSKQFLNKIKIIFFFQPEDKKKSMRDKFQKIISEGEKRGKNLKVDFNCYLRIKQVLQK